MILLDTHVWIRMVREPARLSRPAVSAIRRQERSRGLGVSALTVWEAAWLQRRGLVRTPIRLSEWLDELISASEVTVELPTPSICLAAAELPTRLGSDPCDRLIVATALTLGCPLVTADERIRASGCVETIW